jgi:hypothetical protein
MGLRHYKKMVKLHTKERAGAILLKAVELNRQRLLARAEGAVPMRTNLDAETLGRRVEVFETLSKLADHAFLSLVEGNGPRLGGRQGVGEVHEFVHQRQLEAVRGTLADRMVGLFCDGSKANYLIEATVSGPFHRRQRGHSAHLHWAVTYQSQPGRRAAERGCSASS